ncbi:hypothetical protein OROHE_001688 [Orobanche hederae]
MRADLMAALLQSGCMALSRADAAPICGQDIDVPDRILYFTTRLSSAIFVGEDASLQAASIFIPGAVISGCIARKRFIQHLNRFIQHLNFGVTYKSYIKN